MANAVAMDIRSPMLHPDEQWPRHSPLLSELDSFCASGFSSRTAALVTTSDLDDLIAELDSSIGASGFLGLASRDLDLHLSPTYIS